MKYAICNETFEGWDHRRVCHFVSDLGYTGLEIAPFTLAPLITEVSGSQRKQIRVDATDCGLQILGLHWLLAKTEGFHLNSPEKKVRQRTAEYLVELAKCCRDLGGDILVLGSPVQRKIPQGATTEQAYAFAAATLRRAMPGVADCGVKLCLEPLGPTETDFINTCSEGMQLIEMVDHPDVVLHLDVKAMSTESATVPDLIRNYGPKAGHFHANDPNRRGPGFGDVDFKPIFAALKESGYAGWVSVEVFDYSPDPETIARESIAYMRKCEV